MSLANVITPINSVISGHRAAIYLEKCSEEQALGCNYDAIFVISAKAQDVVGPIDTLLMQFGVGQK